MARILLGVSGGIAAYKAVEVVRLATAAGHSVRVIQTPASQRFVGAATFEGVTGAPGAGRRVRARPRPRRLPGRPRRRPRPDLPPGAGAPLRRLRGRARLGQHAGQAGRRARGQPAQQRRAGLHRAAGAGARDEQPHVGARRPRRPTWSSCARAARAWWSPAPAGSPPRASGGWAAWPTRPTCSRRSSPRW